MASLAVAEETGVLEDPVSFEPYKTPTRILPCGHTLNHGTLVGLLSRANIDNEGNRYFVCPLDRQRCRVKPAEEFPQNFQLQQQIEVMREQQVNRKRRLKETRYALLKAGSKLRKVENDAEIVDNYSKVTPFN